MTEVVQLERVDLAGVFDQSLPTAPKLPEWQAARALRLLRAGHDVAGVAMRLQVSVAAILPLKDYLDRRAREQAEREAALAAARADVVQLQREAATSEERQAPPEPPALAEPPNEPEATVVPGCAPPADRPHQQLEQSALADRGLLQTQPPPAPEVDLTRDQRGAIRFLRWVKRVPLESIAQAFRTSVDQVRRVVGDREAPP